MKPAKAESVILQRNDQIDNAKGVLMFLVVFGHLLEAPQGWIDDVLRAILTILYVFHMPAFAFFSGMTTKSKFSARRIGVLLAMLAIFQVVYVVFDIARGAALPTLLAPYWILWFLLSLTCWIIALPMVLRLPAPLLLSLGVALGAGALPFVGYKLGLSRTLVLFPFFLTGFLHGRSLSSRYVRPIVASGAIVAAGLVVYALNFQPKWLFHADSYKDLGGGLLSGVATRAVLFCAASISIFAFAGAIPSATKLFTRIGRYSLAVFLLHGPIVRGSTALLVDAERATGPWLYALGAIPIAGIICWLLGREDLDQSIRRTAEWITELFLPLPSGRKSEDR